VEKNPLRVALYIALFPQLVAGPIVRYKDVAAQVAARRHTLDGFAKGVARFAFGLGKKAIVANTVAATADRIFGASPSGHSPGTAWLGLLCYSLQIYYDFSGYSDMAIGLGKMFGFEFLENFSHPYASKSVSEFWRRWHISLSSFFRDYVYIPLGGNRRGNVYAHLLIVFFLTGLWHGAAWNFIVWGLWHGAFMLAERRCRGRRLRVPAVARRLYTVLVVAVGWVLFRADSLGDAWTYLQSLFGLRAPVRMRFETGFYLNNYLIFVVLIGALGALDLHGWARRRWAVTPRRQSAWHAARTLAACVTLLLAAVAVLASTYNPFIYFRF
jgi:alginate O-acetyltransferase complex protein AlgI